MGWVVKGWRSEGFAALVTEQAHEAARGVLQAAEREARRMHRVARRERVDAEGELRRLETLGSELRQGVRHQRMSIRGSEPAGAGSLAPTIRARDLRPPRPKDKRSRLRNSPLAELFQATDRRSA